MIAERASQPECDNKRDGAYGTVMAREESLTNLSGQSDHQGLPGSAIH